MYPPPLIDKTTQLVAFLKHQRFTVTTAESCTGGLVGGLITSVAGASKVFNQGIITYSNQAKMQMLGVNAELLRKHGAVSRQVAKAMAEGALSKTNAQMALAITGIAGPGGGHADKPVGLVYIAVASPASTITRKHIFSGDRQEVRLKACDQMIQLALECLT